MKSWILLVLGTALYGAEGGPATLAGRVTDPSGAVVPGAVVKVANRANGQTIEIATDGGGRFRATGLRSGIYDLAAGSPGFAPYSRKDVEIAGGRTTNLDVVLQISALAEAVTVTAKAPPGEGALETSARNSREILEIREVRESAAKDVGEAIASLDGLWKIRKAGIANDVVLRGFQQGNINLIIDGERIYGACPSHMDPSASHVDFAEIETVEVVKGPFNVRDQGSLGGTVSVVSKKPAPGFELTPNLAAGSFGFWNPSLTTSFTKGRFYALAGYSFRRSDPYLDGRGRSFTTYANYTAAGADHPAFNVQTGWGRFGVALATNQNLEVAFTHQAGGLTLYPALQMDAPYDNADRVNANWSVRELTGLVKQVRVESYFSRVRHWMTDELRAGGVGTPLGYSMGSLAATRALGGRIEADLPGTIVGIEGYNRGWSVNGSMLMGGMYSARPSLPDVRMLIGGIYAQHSRQFGRWSVTFGGRADVANSAALNRSLDTGLYWAYHSTRSTSTADAAPSGNVRATYRLPRGIELFAGVGSSVRVPDPEERYYAVRRTGSDWVGNPTLEPTRNTEADAGINLRSRYFTLRPTVFYSRLADFIAIASVARANMVPGMMNSSARSYEGVDARMYGGEVSYSVGFTRALMLGGGVSYVRGIEFAKPAAGLPKTDMAEIPPLKSRASLRYGTSLFFAEINGLASAPQNRIETLLQEQRTAGYALLGFRAGIHHRQFNIAAGVDNALDRFYYEHLSFQRDPYRSGVRVPEPGRTLYLNVSMNVGSAR
jgi:iron complex outermembrane recepter protein